MAENDIIMNLDAKKIILIKEIMKIEEENLLDKLNDDIKESQNEQLTIFEKATQPTRQAISIEEMVKEQNYKPISSEEFFKLADELDIKESLEHLLAQLD